MKILLYGFKQFKNHKQNITQEIIQAIPSKKGLYKKVFPVKFDRKMFLDAVNKFKPDVIIGLGQCSQGNKIRIERRAVNLYKGNKKIVKNKPKYLFSNIKIKPDRNSYISYDAGKYVCNYSMYLMADYADQNKIKFAFVHIPEKYSKDKAQKFINKIIKKYGSKS